MRIYIRSLKYDWFKMNQLLVLLAVLGLTWAAPSLENKASNFTRFSIGGRIVGGVEADIRDIPYQAALLRNGAQICGGALIADDIILTAAHCVAPSVISNVNQLSFRVGSTQWNSNGQVIAARQIFIHEQYQDCDWCEPDYDIAVVTLQARATVPNAIPIPLAPANRQYAAGTYSTVSGWGVTSSGAWASPVNLRRVDVPVFDQARCRNVYGSIISERTICAGYQAGGKDSCQGDSGGPLAVNGELAGIVSFGAGCALAGYPGVYASVPGFNAWINRHTR